MSQVYIPDIGSIVECAEPWSFVLYNEHRNDAMMQATGLKPKTFNYDIYGKPLGVVELPAGTKLRVDRIFIRKGMADFSSLTFVIQETSDQRFYELDKKGKMKLKKIRFWAKLADINSGNWNLISDPSMDPGEI